MMKKLMSLCFAVLLALLPVLALADSDETAKTQLLSLWSEYLAIQDEIIHDDLMVCEALIALDESRTWEQMLRTRAVVAAAMTNRSALGAISPGEGLSIEQQLRLVELGVDVDPYVITMDELNAYLDVDLLTLLDFSTNLIGYTYDIESLAWTKDWAVLKKDMAVGDAVYLCGMTNHLLNTLGDEENAASYWNEMDTLYPTLSGYRKEFNPDDASLEKFMDEYITQMEASQLALAEHVGQGEYIIDSMIYALETGSPYFSKENMIVYEGAPVKLPLAPWWGELGKDIFAYYTLDAESNMIRITMDSDLSVTPDVEVVQTSGVAKQDVIDYASYLTDIGLQASSLSGHEANEEPFSVTLRKGSIMLIVRWNNGSASVWNVGNRVMFVPDWYVILANQK